MLRGAPRGMRVFYEFIILRGRLLHLHILLSQEKQKSKEVTSAAEKDEDVPQHMVIPHLLTDIENNTAGVEETTRQQPP